MLVELISSQEYLINPCDKICALEVDDCCLCLSMICGSQDGSSTLNELNCKGDNGCQGVGDMQIHGEKRYLILIFV